MNDARKMLWRPTLGCLSLVAVMIWVSPACGPTGGSNQNTANSNDNDSTPVENENTNDNTADNQNSNENTNDNTEPCPQGSSTFQLTEFRYTPSAVVAFACPTPDTAGLRFEGTGGSSSIVFPATVEFSVLSCEEPCDLSLATLDGAVFELTEETGLQIPDAVQCAIPDSDITSYSIFYEATMTDACGQSLGSASRLLVCCEAGSPSCSNCP